MTDDFFVIKARTNNVTQCMCKMAIISIRKLHGNDKTIVIKLKKADDAIIDYIEKFGVLVDSDNYRSSELVINDVEIE